MICSNCNNQINDRMNFCPYCGTRYGISVDVEDFANNKNTIEKLYLDNRFDDILDIALGGDNIAKNYYIKHVKSYAQLHRGYHYTGIPELQKIQTLSLDNNPFASAAYGVFLCDNSKSKIQAWDYEARNKTIAEGIALIKKAAEKHEVAAITILADWASQGLNGVTKDEVTAYKLIKEAADQLYAPAMYILGLWHYRGINGASKKEDIGYTMIEKAAFYGDDDAIKLILQNDQEWFSTELGFSRSQKELESLQKVANNVWGAHIKDINGTNIYSDFANEINLCRSVQDYINLHSRVQRSSAIDSSKKIMSEWLCSIVSEIMDIPFDNHSISNVFKLKDDYQKAINLINKYFCLQHFLYLKNDLLRMGVRFDDLITQKIMNQASKIIRTKFKDKIRSVLSYNKASNEIKESGSSFGTVVVSFVITIILSYFFGTIGIIIGAIAILGALTNWHTTHKNKGTVAKEKDNYLLVNALIGYGYKPFEPYEEDNFQYDEKVTYDIKIKSFLDSPS